MKYINGISPHAFTGQCNPCEILIQQRFNILIAALWKRTGHYIFVLWFLLSSSSFFPRLISADADWMSTILLRCGPSVNLECMSEMCYTRLAENAGPQKIVKNSPPGHHRTTLYGYIRDEKSCVPLYWQRYCTAHEQWASTKLCGVQKRAPPIFGRAAITLGIGPHSSW